MHNRLNICLFILCLFIASTAYANSAEKDLAESVKQDLRDYNDFNAKNTAANCELYREAKGKERFEDWKRAAEAGIPEGQVLLSICYIYGIGVSEDEEEAYMWARKAAEQGNTDGQWRIGMAYAFGVSVSEDREEAVKWFRKAAEQ